MFHCLPNTNGCINDTKSSKHFGNIRSDFLVMITNDNDDPLPIIVNIPLPCVTGY